MDDEMTIRAGARLDFVVERADSEAVSATFLAVKQEDAEIIITDTVEYDEDGNAQFQFDSPDTDIVGLYDYQVNENFESGSPDIYPNGDDCEEDCDFPTLEICESLDETGS